MYRKYDPDSLFYVIILLASFSLGDNRSIHRREGVELEFQGVQWRVYAGRSFEVSKSCPSCGYVPLSSSIVYMHKHKHRHRPHRIKCVNSHFHHWHCYPICGTIKTIILMLTWASFRYNGYWGSGC